MTTPKVQEIDKTVHVPPSATAVRTGSRDAYVLAISGYKLVTEVGEISYMQLPVSHLPRG